MKLLCFFTLSFYENLLFWEWLHDLQWLWSISVFKLILHLRYFWWNKTLWIVTQKTYLNIFQNKKCNFDHLPLSVTCKIKNNLLIKNLRCGQSPDNGSFWFYMCGYDMVNQGLSQRFRGLSQWHEALKHSKRVNGFIFGAKNDLAVFSWGIGVEAFLVAGMRYHKGREVWQDETVVNPPISQGQRVFKRRNFRCAMRRDGHWMGEAKIQRWLGSDGAWVN